MWENQNEHFHDWILHFCRRLTSRVHADPFASKTFESYFPAVLIRSQGNVRACKLFPLKTKQKPKTLWIRERAFHSSVRL